MIRARDIAPLPFRGEESLADRPGKERGSRRAHAILRALLPSARMLVGEGEAARVKAVPHRPQLATARSFPRLFAYAVPALLLAGCAATQNAGAVAPAAPGFLLGVWHGFIFPVAWIVSLFMPDVAVYAVPNDGGWYDFGYFIGIVFLGVGARKSHVVRRRR